MERKFFFNHKKGMPPAPVSIKDRPTLEQVFNELAHQVKKGQIHHDDRSEVSPASIRSKLKTIIANGSNK
jgi:hypothetical protein